MGDSPFPPPERNPRKYEVLAQEFVKQKANFKWEGGINSVDPMLVEFLQKLNKNPHIVTLFSCEGHAADIMSPNWPYLVINMDEEGHEIFWNFCVRDILIAATAKNYTIGVEINTDAAGVNGVIIRGYVHSSVKHLYWPIIFDLMLQYFPSS